MQSGNGRNWEAGAKLLKLALALYRKELSEQPDAEPSEAMLMLLQLANGDPELMQWATSLVQSSEDEVHRCCIAFIERELFATRTDPYGVLGLNPWAAIADIKEHYRLLIRLFHPDRGLVSASSAEIYAAMINQAYSELKKLIPAGTGALSKPAPAVAFHAHSIPERRRAHASPSDISLAVIETWGLLSWLTPAKVLFIIAILAILIVAVFFKKENRPDVGHIDAIADTRASLPYFLLQEEIQPIVGDVDSKLEEPVEDYQSETPVSVEKASAANKDIEIPVNDEGLTEAIKPAKTRAAITGSGSSSGFEDVKRSPAVQKVIKPVVEADKPENHDIVEPIQANLANSGDANIQSFARQQNSSLNPDIADAGLNEIPSDRELHDLIAHFMDSYHRGDTSEFIQLFDEDVRTDGPAGTLVLQNTYARFFENTLSRSMVIKDLHWKRNGAFVIGQAEYRASTLRSKDDESVSSSGTLRFEVAKSGARVSIVGFYHQAAKK